jgi:hypothetical protein
MPRRLVSAVTSVTIRPRITAPCNLGIAGAERVSRAQEIRPTMPDILCAG